MEKFIVLKNAVVERLKNSFKPSLSIERRNKQLSDVAIHYFLTASVKYPASITAQGAYISMLCRQYNYDPVQLAVPLLNDAVAIDKATRAANISHQNRSYAPIEEISPEKVKIIIYSDYRIAISLSILELNDIENLLSLYPQFRDLKRKGFDENEIEHIYEDDARELVNQKVRKLPRG